MREIKFRAWHPSSSDMIYFDNEKAANDQYIAHSLLLLMANQHPQGKDLLMQFAGLTDKNGVEVFEGDVLSGFDGKLICTCNYSDEDAGFWFKSVDSVSGGMANKDYAYNFHVVGNIHQHPELLGGDE